MAKKKRTKRGRQTDRTKKKKVKPIEPKYKEMVREKYMAGWIYCQRTHREVSLGWVLARLSRALVDNPLMDEVEVLALVDSLAASAPA